MKMEEKYLVFLRSIIVVLFISIFYLDPILAQNSDSGTCGIFTKLQNEKLNIEKQLNETKQNFLPNLILEKSLTLKLDDLNSKLALFSNDDEITKLQNEKLNIEKQLNET
jgi:hypothetical protein